MAVWPATLPRPNSRFSAGGSYENMRLKMDSGRVRQKPKYTTGVMTARLTFEFTAEQMAIFKLLHSDDLNQGSDWFTMDLPNPDDSSVTASQVRFADGYKQQFVNFDAWQLTIGVEYFTIELLPGGFPPGATNPDGSINWPETELGQPSSFSVDYKTATARSRITTGRVNTRPRATNHTEYAELSYQFDREQYAIFVYTFEVNLHLGNDWFQMNLPVPDAVTQYTEVRARIVSDYKARYLNVDNWNLSFTVEYEIPAALLTLASRVASPLPT